MIKYKVAIVEDVKLEYDLVKEKIIKTPELEFCTDIPLTKHEDSDAYCNKLLNTEAQILFIDWELEFENRTFNIDKIFEWLSNKKFVFQSHYWIFYTNRYLYMPGYVRKYFPKGSKCYEITGKDEITDIKKHFQTEHDKILVNKLYKEPDLFRQAILNGIKYIEGTKVPMSISSIRIIEEKIISIRFTRVMDLDNKPGTNAVGMVQFYASKFLCYAFNDENGIFAYFDAETNILKFALVKITQSNSHVREKLKVFPKIKSMIYNPTFFDENTLLNLEIRPYVYYRTPQLFKSYDFVGNSNTNTMYSNRESIDKILGVLKNHHVLEEIELP